MPNSAVKTSAKKAVLALGGNAIIQQGQRGTITEQFANTRASLEAIIPLVEDGYQLVITHGNGPQVGNLLLMVEAASDKVAPLPLGVCNAATEGTMGYMIEQSLQNKLKNHGVDTNVVCLLSQVVVSKDDPSMKEPSKPVGPFMNEAEAKKRQAEQGWDVVEDAGRGWRRVVPSPMPLKVIPSPIIKQLVESGNIVIAGGGGGIPIVIEENGTFEGVDAVIDKDLASAVLAKEIDAHLLVILTGVDQVALNFGKPDEQKLAQLTVAEAKKYLDEGHFPKGSMGPKIKAAIKFIEEGGEEVLITSIEKIVDALAGKTGTKIVE